FYQWQKMHVRITLQIYIKILKINKMSQNAKLIIQRIRQGLNINSDKEFCLMLGIKQNTLSTWKKRDTLDFNKIISLCEQNNLDLNEIFFNEDDICDSKVSDIEKENAKTKTFGDKRERQDFKIEKLKKVNMVNTNKEI